MSTMASQITSLTIVYSTVYLGVDQRKHQSSASLAFVWGIHRRPVNFPHKVIVTRKMFPFDDAIIEPVLVMRGNNPQWYINGNNSRNGNRIGQYLVTLFSESWIPQKTIISL